MKNDNDELYRYAANRTNYSLDIDIYLQWSASLIQLLSGFVEICFILKTSYLHKLWPIIGYFTFTINE